MSDSNFRGVTKLSYDLAKLTDMTDGLRGMPSETEWVEFKVNNSKPEKLGHNISALSNAATLHDKDFAYLVFGINDETHEVVGTTFKPRATKVGGEDIESWIAHNLDPGIHFVFHEFEYSEGVPVVIVEITAAAGFPTSFQKEPMIRVGSYTKPLSKNRGKEKALWQKLDKKVFEVGVARDDLSQDEVIARLDYPTVFRKLEIPLPSDKQGIIDKLIEEELVGYVHKRYHITNLGAVLFAYDLSLFPSLRKKALRVIVYDGIDKFKPSREQKGQKGYANAIEGIVDFVKAQTPASERLEGVDRVEQSAYPTEALREVIANALIHQDFTIGGAGPMVEIYSNRIEVSNPGHPLVEIKRIIDHSPRSRNEKLAGLMNRMGLCDERGSGVDRIVLTCELNQLPAPEFSAEEDFTRAKLFAHKSLRDLTKEDKIRAAYYHAVMKHLSGTYMTNNTLRERFGIAKANYPTASGIIKLALEAKVIKTRDEETTTKYVPYWA